MPRYLGPYDVLKLEEGGKEYHPGDNVPLTKEQRTALGPAHRFEGEEQVPAVAVVSNERDEAHAPNEFGVPEAPGKRATSSAPSASAAAKPD